MRYITRAFEIQSERAEITREVKPLAGGTGEVFLSFFLSLFIYHYYFLLGSLKNSHGHAFSVTLTPPPPFQVFFIVVLLVSLKIPDRLPHLQEFLDPPL